MLCILYQNIQFKRYLELTREETIALLTYCDEWPPENYDEDEILSSDLGIVGLLYESFYFHHRNLESLRKAADDGCNFCYQIFYGLFETTVLGRNIENSSERLYLDLQPPCIHKPEIEHLYHGDLDVRLGAESLGRMRLKDLENFAKFAPSSHNMEHNSSTGSSTNLDLVARWLRDCTNYHEHCRHQPQMESKLPHRVLDVGTWEKPQKTFLSVGEDRIGSYAALSYCWGKSEKECKYLTTNENLEQRQEAVDISTFPKTFTDAIAVCRHLGIRFLWIDLLYIIQGNKSDWETESKRIGDIYSNATVTIAAAIGKDSNSGLFIDRDSRKIYPCTLNFQYPDVDGIIRKGAFLTCLDSYWPKTAYLDIRSWTFQEKYLSPQTLIFSETKMLWACTSSNASEGLPIGLQPLNSKSDFDKYILADINRGLPTQIDMAQRYHWWYQAIEIYSHRVFTYESDRLIALAGLATKFQRPEDEFLYGLWRSDLVHGLAWRFGGQYTQTATGTNPKPPIPSWSWASHPGNIITYSDGESPGLVMELNESITSYHTPQGSLQHTFIEVLSVEPMPPATSPSASSTSRTLRLRGLVLRVSPVESSVACNDSSWSTIMSMVLFRYSSSSTNQVCKQFLGNALYDEAIKKGDNLYCLPLSVLPSESHDKSIRRSNANTQTRLPFEDIGIDELVSMQNMSLELGIGILPTMTWCAGVISCCRLERNDALSCLLLKIVDTEEMKFRRVGYLQIMDGRLFEGLAPITLEII